MSETTLTDPRPRTTKAEMPAADIVQMNLLASVSDKAERHTSQVYSQLSDGAWHTAKALKLTLGVDDRTMRLIADRSHGAILGGQSGYKLTRCASVEEIDHAERWLISQANKMRERAVEIRRARNQGGVAA